MKCHILFPGHCDLGHWLKIQKSNGWILNFSTRTYVAILNEMVMFSSQNICHVSMDVDLVRLLGSFVSPFKC